ncbi:hypothetical protein Q7P35_011816 [Cladosporium inversicolor]
MPFTRYKVPIPESATICTDWPSLCTRKGEHWDDKLLEEKYGGYVVEVDGTIVLACTDDLCAVVDEKSKGLREFTFHEPGSGVAISNYTIDMPASARICTTWPSLVEAAVRRPDVGVEKKYGGYVIEVDGVVAIACDEGLCADIQSHAWILNDFREEVAERLGSKSGRTAS